MPLVKVEVSKRLETFLLSLQDKPTQQDRDRIKKYSKGFTDWLVDTLTDATITVNAGIPVSTAGSPSAQTGATTGPGTGNIT